MPAEVHIGTSGWHYRHWAGPFYPARLAPSKMLAYYCERFDTVELNNSFYRLPLESALENWRELTPVNFLFAVKGSRYLTHMKKLKDPEPGLERFFQRADLLGKKLGPVLFQLPPHWGLDVERLKHFLKAVPRQHRYAFEFRDASWNVRETYETLARFNAAYCAFDLAGFQSPVEVTADFAYVRLHGPGGKYQGSYSDEALGVWAARIDAWRRKLKAVFVYFDNDQAGYAAKDALRLKGMT